MGRGGFVCGGRGGGDDEQRSWRGDDGDGSAQFENLLARRLGPFLPLEMNHQFSCPNINNCMQ